MKEVGDNLERELELCRMQLSSLRRQCGEEKEKREQLEQEVTVKCEQLKESRNNLMTIFDGFPEPLFLLDRDARIQMLNRAATLYCQTDYRQAIGKPCAEICPQEKEYCAECSIPDIARQGKELTFERIIDGTPDRTELITLFPLSAGKHGIQGTIFRIQDITEKEKMNEQMVLADRLASLSRLSSGISHEIRNPLAGIMLFVDILADPKSFSRSNKELEILDEIKESVRKITDIISRVFDFARLNSSHKLPSDINKLLEDILGLWTPKVKRAGIEPELSLQPDLPYVTADSVELQEVFSNLILNAVEAMAEGGTLTITTATALSAFHAQRKIVLVTVKDTGKGIPRNLRKTVFNPFFSTKSDGSGLGLAISYQIIKRHGGVLFCSKSGEEGTLFSIELPLDDQHGRGER